MEIETSDRPSERCQTRRSTRDRRDRAHLRFAIFNSRRASPASLRALNAPTYTPTQEKSFRRRREGEKRVSPRTTKRNGESRNGRAIQSCYRRNKAPASMQSCAPPSRIDARRLAAFSATPRTRPSEISFRRARTIAPCTVGVSLSVERTSPAEFRLPSRRRAFDIPGYVRIKFDRRKKSSESIFSVTKKMNVHLLESRDANRLKGRLKASLGIARVISFGTYSPVRRIRRAGRATVNFPRAREIRKTRRSREIYLLLATWRAA